MAPDTTRAFLEMLSPARQEALRVVAALLGPRGQGWLVGGALRDALLAERSGDLDVAVPGGGLALARALADRTGGSFVTLDEARGAGRVVGRVQVDVADLRAPTLADDLRGRDFTVNALAAPIQALVEQGSAVIEDPTGGLGDLRGRVVRLCAPDALRDDSVRALRAVRLAIGARGWRLHQATARAIREAATLVTGAAAERVRDELVAILAAPAAGAGLRMLDDLGVLPVLLPESLAMRTTQQPAPHRFDVWEHSLRAVEAADAVVAELDVLEPWGETLRVHLAQDLGDKVTRRVVLKLGALLHDIAKPETLRREAGRIRFIGHDAKGAGRARRVAERFRFSRRAAELVERLVAEHLRPMHLAQSGGVTRRARHRFFRALQDDARDLLLLALADAAAVTGEAPRDVWRAPGGLIVRELMRGMSEEALAAEVPPLLRGEAVMRAFGLAPGPQVGRLLSLALEAQALGLVGTAEEALQYLRRVAGEPFP